MPHQLDITTELERQYPRIVLELENIWGTKECNHYLKQLVFDERGGRQGFPPEVLVEIAMLEYISNSETGEYERSIELRQLDNPLYGGR